MPDADQTYAWAEQAVGTVIVDIRQDLAVRWRGQKPANIGLNADDWLDVSRGMIRLFNELAEGLPPVSMSEPARAAYRKRALIAFVTAIADLADQVP